MKRKGFELIRTCFILQILAAQLSTVGLVFAQPGAPYPASQVITGISFDWTSHIRLAPGSDNWAITWADDNHQYTSWGDGGGFGGTNSNGRVSLGVGRVEGMASVYTGFNVWGGFNRENPSQFPGKSRGIISIAGTLYMWRCGDASTTTAYDFQELYSSTDHGATWVFTGVRFDPASFPGADDGFFCPTFLQFGQDYAGARDGFVYMYAPEIQTAAFNVHTPGQITLMRVPIAGLSNPAQYQFFTGLDLAQNPLWSTNASARQPVFQDVTNGVMFTSVSYNPGLGRYLLITNHSQFGNGNIGIYDAPEPWGPWTTVFFDPDFGTPNIEDSTFFWNFSNKWLSGSGLDFVLVFTGTNTNDSWNTVEGSFFTTGVPPTATPTPTATSTGGSSPTSTPVANTTDPSSAAAPPDAIFDPAINLIGFLPAGAPGGGSVEWIITVVNNGGLAGTNLIITHTLGDNLRIDRIEGASAVSIDGQLVTITLPALAPGQVIQLNIFTTLLAEILAISTACVIADNLAVETCTSASAIRALPNTGETPLLARSLRETLPLLVTRLLLWAFPLHQPGM